MKWVCLVTFVLFFSTALTAQVKVTLTNKTGYVIETACIQFIPVGTIEKDSTVTRTFDQLYSKDLNITGRIDGELLKHIYSCGTHGKRTPITATEINADIVLLEDSGYRVLVTKNENVKP